VGVVLMLPHLSGAGDSVSKVAGKVLQIGIGARAVGMGEAQTAIADDVYSLFWNPSGISRIRQIQVSLMHNAWFGGISSEYIGCAMPLYNGAFGISLNYTNFGEFEKYGIDSNNYPILQAGKFSPFTLVAAFGYGRWVNPNLALGGGVKLISEGVDTYNNFSAAADLGLQYQKLLPGLDAGLTIQNIGLPLQGFGLPLNIKAGLGYRIPFVINEQKDRFLMSFDLNLPVPLDQPSYTNFGLEYWYHNTIALRAGYKISEINSLGSDSGITAGLGIRMLDYTMDYAFNSFGALGATHRVSFTAAIGEAKKVKRAKRGMSKTMIGSGAKQDASSVLIPKLSGLSLRTPIAVSVKGDISPSDKSKTRLDRAAFTFQFNERVEVEEWELRIIDAQNKIIRRYTAKGNPRSMTWNGKDEVGRQPAESAFASYEFIYTLKEGTTDRLSGKLIEAKSENFEPRQVGGEAPLKIEPVHFEEGSYDLTPAAVKEINQASQAIKSRPYTRIAVEGYTDGRSEKSQEFLLSQRRADAVARYLAVAFKIPLTSITLHARGSKNAVASNQSEAGCARNRRVESSVVNAH